MKSSGSSSSMVSKNVLAIGIDLGTTYSRVGFWVGEELIIRKIASCIAFTDYAEPIIGDEAFDGVDTNPSNTILDVKRLTGVKFSDNPTQRDLLICPFEVIANPFGKNDEPYVIVRSFNRLRRFSAEELLSMILKKLKQIAEESLGLDENGGVIIIPVISVPTCFNNAQRLATKQAATMAGFGASRLINETSATALAYGWHKKKKSRQDQQQRQQHCVETRITQEDEEENVLIYDLGGGTLSVAVVNIKDGWNRYEVKSVAGDTHLGGKDFTAVLSLYCSDRFDEMQNDVCESARSKSRLRFACEDAKIFLSDPRLTQTTVDVDSYHVLTSNTQSKRKALPLSLPVTQDRFDEECEDLLDRCEEAADQCIIESGIYDFHEVIVVGGSTGIPKIREMLREFCVDGQGFCEIMNPDIAVVQGAAIQAAILSGEALSNSLLNSISIADVAPLSLHTLTLINLIPRNTMIPTERRHRLSTARNNQRSLYVEVHEGEDEIIENNNLTGYFFFGGIQAAGMGVPNITVTFAVDHDGILNVSAAEDESHRQLARWVINRKLTTDELEANPEQEVEEESKTKKLEAKFEVWLFVTKHMSREVLDDFDVGFSVSQAGMIREAVADAKRWLENNELPEVRASELKLDELQRTYFLILHERGP